MGKKTNEQEQEKGFKYNYTDKVKRENNLKSNEILKELNIEDLGK
jgi:hypothetical protein